MVLPRRRSARQGEKEKEKEREKEKEKQPTPEPESPTIEEAPEDEDEEDDEEEEQEEAEDQSEESEAPLPEPPKKRRGRPPKKPSYIDPAPYDEEVDGSTPLEGSPTAVDSPSGAMKRGGKRGRPSGTGIGRGRIRPSASQSASNTQADNAAGDIAVESYEYVLEPDPAGERKVMKNGNLLGGREYRCRTFTMTGRGNQLYMLSTEPARCMGFRDSYLFFQKHRKLFKIICTEDEKFDLINRELLLHSYKGRAIGIVTARSVFREFGAKIIVGGRKITDDYYEQIARDRGDVEGEIADPSDVLPPPGVPYDVNQYVAWHGASSVYHNRAPPAPEVRVASSGGLFTVPNRGRKKLTGENWMAEHAVNASQYNSLLLEHRLKAKEGVYDPHTNLMFYPQNMQPTAVHVEKLGNSLPPASEFFDSTVPEDERNYAPETKVAYEFEIVSPPQTLNFAPGDMAAWKKGSGHLAVEDLNWRAPLALSLIPPDVYDDVPEDCKAAIQQRIEAEQKWINRFD